MLVPARIRESGDVDPEQPAYPSVLAGAFAIHAIPPWRRWLMSRWAASSPRATTRPGTLSPLRGLDQDVQHVGRRERSFGRARAPPVADNGAPGGRGEVADGDVTGPAVWLVGGLYAAEQHPVEQRRIARLGEERRGLHFVPGRRSDRRGDAAVQHRQVGQVADADPGAAVALHAGDMVVADRYRRSSRDRDGHVLEAAGHEGHRCVAVFAVEGEEPGHVVERLDHRDRPFLAQAGFDHAAPFSVTEFVALAEYDETGQRVVGGLPDDAERPGRRVPGMLLPGTRAGHGQADDVVG